jgi:osmoprotectant transport system permease protein
MRLGARILIIACVAAAAVAMLLILKPSPEGGGLKAAFDAEFLTRPDGYPGLARHYEFEFPDEPLQMDPGLMYKAVAEGSVDVIDGFATDGRIPAYDLVVLEDDKMFFPPYHAAPLVRRKALEENPGLEETLRLLDGKIDDTTMQRMNYEVDEKGAAAAEVARSFLEREGLLSEKEPGSSDAGEPIRIGSKHFTEQEIVGELMAILVEERLGVSVERKLNMGGTMICFNALRSGDIDLYAEYTGTGLVSILKKDALQDPDETLAVVREAFAEEYGLQWLAPFGFNNTYTLTMRRAHADYLGIRTVSDLGKLVRTAAQFEKQ